MDPYAVLHLPQNASQEEIKAAYHRALLDNHPDKRAGSTADIAAIKDAYRVLSTPHLRPTGKPRSRPAQLISLEDFEETDEVWAHACRCGGVYRITADDMEQGQHLIPCSSCSEVVWVGYELVEE